MKRIFVPGAFVRRVKNDYRQSTSRLDFLEARLKRRRGRIEVLGYNTTEEALDRLYLRKAGDDMIPMSERVGFMGSGGAAATAAGRSAVRLRRGRLRLPADGPDEARGRPTRGQQALQLRHLQQHREQLPRAQGIGYGNALPATAPLIPQAPGLRRALGPLPPHRHPGTAHNLKPALSLSSTPCNCIDHLDSIRITHYKKRSTLLRPPTKVHQPPYLISRLPNIINLPPRIFIFESLCALCAQGKTFL
jgi:hypothetical protein